MVSPYPLALPRPGDNPINSPHTSINETMSIKNKQLFEYQHLLLLETPGANVIKYFTAVSYESL